MATPATNITPLHRAAESGDVDKVRHLLEHGSYGVNCTDSLGQTPLHYACAKGCVNTARVLVQDFKADMSVKDAYGATAIDMVRSCGHHNIAQALQLFTVEIRTSCAAEKGEAFSSEVVANDTVSGRVHDDLKTTSNADLDEVLVFVAMQSSIASEIGLETEKCEPDIKTALELLNVGKSSPVSEIVSVQDTTGEGKTDTPHDTVLVQDFKADMGVKDTYGATAIRSCGHHDVAQALKQLPTAENKTNCTAEMSEPLSSEAETVLGKTTIPIDLKTEGAKVDEALVLLAAQSSIASDFGLAEDEEEKSETDTTTALELRSAVQSSTTSKIVSVEGTTLTRDSEADTTNTGIDLCSEEGTTGGGETDTVACASDPGPVPIHVHALRTVVNEPGHNTATNITPLHRAAESGDVDKVRHLLEHGSYDVNCTDSLRQTPLHYACAKGCVNTARVLVQDFKADMSVKDAYGATAIDMVRSCGHHNIAQALQLFTVEIRTSCAAEKGEAFSSEVVANDTVSGRVHDDLKTTSNADLDEVLVFVAMQSSIASEIGLETEKCEPDIKTALELLNVGKSSPVSEIVSVQDTTGEGKTDTPHDTVLVQDFKADMGVKDTYGATAIRSCGHHDVAQALKQLPTAENKTNCTAEMSEPLSSEAETVLGKTTIPIDLKTEGAKVDEALVLLAAQSSIASDFGLAEDEEEKSETDTTTALELRSAVQSSTTSKIVSVEGTTLTRDSEADTTNTGIDLCSEEGTTGGGETDTVACASDPGPVPIHVHALRTVVNEPGHNTATNITPLHRAAESGDVDKVRHLLEHGSYDVNCTDSLRQTPLHYACAKGCVNTARVLVQDFKADMGIKDTYGATAIDTVRSCGHHDIAQALQQLSTAEIKTSCTAEKGESLSSESITNDTALGKTSIHADLKTEESASSADLHEALVLLATQSSIAREFGLAEDEAEMSETDITTALELLNAIQSSTIEDTTRDDEADTTQDTDTGINLGSDEDTVGESEIDTTVACDADPGPVPIHAHAVRAVASEHDTATNITPLHQAAELGDVDKVRHLLEHGSYDVNCTDSLGQTPLHYACAKGCVNTARVLVQDFKADMGIKDTYGATAIDMVRSCGHHDIAQAFQQLSTVEIKTSSYTAEKGEPLSSEPVTNDTELVKTSIHNDLKPEESEDLDEALFLLAIQSSIASEFGLEEDETEKSETDITTALQLLNTTTASDICSLKDASDLDSEKDITEVGDDDVLFVSAIRGDVDITLALINIYKFGHDPNVRNSSGRSLLHAACEGGNVSLVQTLIQEHKADVNARDNDGNTPLFVAAGYGQMDVALHLITKFGCDLNVRNSLGWSLLHLACLGGNVSLVQTLIQEHKADVNARDDKGNTPLFVAAFSGQVDAAVFLINKFGCDLNVRNSSGRSLLHAACEGGNVRLVQTLIREHKADVNARDDKGSIPLFLAAACGKVDAAVFLINKFGCDLNVRNSSGTSLLHAACEGGNVSLVQTLIQEHKADVNARDDKGNTPLFVAAFSGQVDAAVFLINKFGCDLNVRNSSGRSLLHAACEGGNVRLVQTLIREHKADVNARDDKGSIPLFLAAACGKVDAAVFLINKFGCDLNVRNSSGTSLLHAACEGGNVRLVQTLIREHKADVNARDAKGNTPLFLAAACGKVDAAVFLINKFGCDLNVRNSSGRSLLHAACEGGNVCLVQTLIQEHKADVNARDDKGNTPLFVAAFSGQVDAAVFLINKFGCDLNVRNSSGRSLLHAACEGGNVRLVQTLIREHKADVNARDDKGSIPLFLAAACGKVDAAVFLINKFGCDLNVRNSSGMSLLHAACEGGNVRLVQTLIREHKADVNARDAKGNTPLFLAAACGKVDAAVFLINKFGCDLNVRNSSGRSLLHAACEGGNVRLVQTLIREHKADVNARDDKGSIPLFLAAACGKVDAAVFLINKFGCDLNVRNSSGRSLLHAACEGGNVCLVQTLIQEHKADVNARDDKGNTPLFVAAFSGQVDAAVFLINKFSCDLNVRNSSGWSLLHAACQGGNVRLVQTLIREHKADVNARDDKGSIPLFLAAACGKVDAAVFLINKFGCDLNVRDSSGRSLLHAACQGGNISLVQTLIEDHKFDVNARSNTNSTVVDDAASCGKVEVVLTLINEFCYDPHTKGFIGRSLLFSACEGGDLSLVKTLVCDYKFDLHEKILGSTVLHQAAGNGNLEVALYFIKEHGFDTNARGYLGQSVLHYACKGGNRDLVQTLILEYGADVICEDGSGNTPLDVAAYCGRANVALYLINTFKCDVKRIGYWGKSVLHHAAEGGSVHLVEFLLSFISVLSIDNDGSTPLHICSNFDRLGCVRALLAHNAPVLIRNNQGKTPVEVSNGMSRSFLVQYLKDNQQKLQIDYDKVLQIAEKRYSGENPITKIFLLGNPGAEKSTLVESIKSMETFSFFGRTLSESSVPPHTAGIVPTMHTSKQSGRVLFFDFAGDPEYYSSHAAILENLASTKTGDNLFIIVVNLEKDLDFITNSLHYWFSFVQHQRFVNSKLSFVIVGSHPDLLTSNQLSKRKNLLQKFSATIQSEFFVLDCRKTRSKDMVNFQKQVSVRASHSTKYNLSREASLLLGLLEKDFGNVSACSLDTILAHVKDCGVCLPNDAKGIASILSELHDIGILLLLGNQNHKDCYVILEVSKLTNEVHKLLFSDTTTSVKSSDTFNIGILPDSVLREILPPYITKQCLSYLQYCQEIKPAEIEYFPQRRDIDIPPELEQQSDITPSQQRDIGLLKHKHHSSRHGIPMLSCREDFSERRLNTDTSQPLDTPQSFAFFPALCKLGKGTIEWCTPPDQAYTIAWLAQCTDPFDFFSTRFFHVLILRLIFTFTLTVPTQKQISTEHAPFQRRCTMWKTGVQWSMTEGVECMVEIVKGNKGVVVITKSVKDRAEKCATIFTKIVNCVMNAKVEFCHTIKPSFFILDSTNEADYFNKDNQFAMSDVENALKQPSRHDVILSVSGQRQMERSRLSYLCRFTHWNTLFPIELSSILYHLKNIVKETYDLGLQLKVPYHILEALEDNFPTDVGKRKRRMINWWMSSFSDPPCWWHLVQALREIERSRIAEDIEKEYGKFYGMRKKIKH